MKEAGKGKNAHTHISFLTPFWGRDHDNRNNDTAEELPGEGENGIRRNKVNLEDRKNEGSWTASIVLPLLIFHGKMRQK